jgi:hypothetical protein
MKTWNAYALKPGKDLGKSDSLKVSQVRVPVTIVSEEKVQKP